MNIPTAPNSGTGVAIASKLNWLRAGVLGANDGIVSTSSIIFGVVGASASHSSVILAGIAAIAAGAMSMAAGEYVSVSSQRDLEDAELERERREIEANPQCELAELQHMLEDRGIDRSLARKVALQLTARDPLTAHARLEFGIDPASVVNPWQAAVASMIAFTAGGLIPLLSMLLAPRAFEIWVSGAAVLVALTLTGWISAGLGGAPKLRSIVRNVLGGLLAMAITYGVGKIAGAAL
ncbi:MAG TPA: VIT family protein [Sphingomicrobium sp.]|nr:VIT family protein [Sphingomicrobium sp.]